MKLKHCLFISLIFLLLAGCKYDEGPGISFRTACNRVCGDWVIEKFYVDGADSLPDLKNDTTYCDYYNFHQNPNNNDFYISAYKNGISQQLAWVGKWELQNDNKYLSFYWEYGPSPYGPFFSGVRWEIKRLANKELWLETVFVNQKKYELKFKAK